ncbi:linear amide C-N hydrolase [Sphaerisporangium corydalis]|uniref:Linear amide C-N hydrolase n=1 Tax=Sphaerisporangium corydalis TaxID=1441875 RepID=A0ABV9EQD3_9ACTN|nr:linear amide C-N hydrolase [Sphaerisporangium corydalis]
MTEPARVAATLLLAVWVLFGCATGAATPSRKGDAVPDPRASSAVRPPLPPEHAAALASLRKIDDHPLWTMTYKGGYDPFATIEPALTPTAFGCSLFSAHGDPADPLTGRNFDYDHHPALLLFTAPPKGHASVSMVDVSYLGVRSDADFTTDAGRRALLKAPLLPFDGMNSKGLVVGMATVPEARPGHDPKRRTAGSVRVMRLVLDGAATVGEALKVFRRYNVDFSGSPPLHYLISDARGRSAVVEFAGGAMVVHHGSGSWQAMVNFAFTGSTARARQADPRYRTAGDTLRAAGGRLSPEQAMDLLSRVRQNHTQWSIVYRQKAGEVRLATGRRYGTVHEFRLPMD